ncbi:MAG TPA: glycosyltransferase family 39 protein, partial [Negativicutes bacterium]|nr:glycosyltransferase family 39 protein [Negativicutes bacterium]
FVHSDEPWLSGLSRNIMEKGDYSVTETFFDLMERHPHAIKIIFHTIQIIFIKLMGYSIFTFRLISLCFGLLTIYFTYRLGSAAFGSRKTALAGAAMLAVDVQFIYASHFARQEIIILFLLVLGMWYKLKNAEAPELKHDAVIGIIIGLAIGIHPNSFIISLPFGLIYLYEILVLKRRKLRSLLIYMATVACFAAFFVSLSLYFDPNFITNYSKYGNSFDVFDPITSKLGEVKYFYLKLYYGVSGTYYTPDIRFQFYIFGAALIISVYKLIKSKGKAITRSNITAILLAILAVNSGIVIIGRFNQTSIVFLFPLFYLLVAYAIEGLSSRYRYAVTALLLTALAFFTFSNYAEFRDNSYNSYLNEISSVIAPQEKTLGNLNSEYCFGNGILIDYRNLAFLRDNNISFAEYIRKNNIKYIIYSEELDFIHELRPKWDGIYGPLDYYDEMKAFLDSNCTLMHEFTDSYYGIRIVRYVGTKAWKIRIYRVDY